MRNIGHLELETRMSLGVTYRITDGGRRVRGDHEVPHGRTVTDPSKIPTMDMLEVHREKIGHRLRLDPIAEAIFGPGQDERGALEVGGVQAGRIFWGRRTMEQIAPVASRV